MRFEGEMTVKGPIFGPLRAEPRAPLRLLFCGFCILVTIQKFRRLTKLDGMEWKSERREKRKISDMKREEGRGKREGTLSTYLGRYVPAAFTLILLIHLLSDFVADFVVDFIADFKRRQSGRRQLSRRQSGRRRPLTHFRPVSVLLISTRSSPRRLPQV